MILLYIQQQQLFLQQNRGYLPVELLFLHYCGDLRGLIVNPPNIGYETNSLIDITGTEGISDGSIVCAERLLSLSPRVVHRVGPAAIDIARSWYQSSTPTGYNSFIRAVLVSERDYTSFRLGAASETMSDVKAQRVRIPLAEVRAKVPSRFVPVKGGHAKKLLRESGNQNDLFENIDVSLSGRPVTPPPPPKTDLPVSSEDDGNYPRVKDGELINVESEVILITK